MLPEVLRGALSVDRKAKYIAQSSQCTLILTETVCSSRERTVQIECVILCNGEMATELPQEKAQVRCVT